jgi:hypothetical protein
MIVMAVLLNAKQLIANTKSPITVVAKNNHNLHWSFEEKCWVPRLFTEPLAADAHWSVTLPPQGVFALY